MSTAAKPDTGKLKRLLALALDASSADGEAMNALKAARKMVADLGGFDAALRAVGVAPERNGSSNGSARHRSGGFAWEYGFHDPWTGAFYDEMRKEAERMQRAQAEAVERERAAKKKAQETVAGKLNINNAEELAAFLQALKEAMK